MKYNFLNSTFRHLNLQKVTFGATMIAIYVGLFLPSSWVQGGILPIAFFLILAGIPHGASDFIVFQGLRNRIPANRQLMLFATGYFIIVLSYSVLWWVTPLTAFIVFLINSVFHFGESNWNYLETEIGWQKYIVYFLWGCAILGVPILLNIQDALVIIGEITGEFYTVSVNSRASSIFLLIFSNILLITYLFDKKLINYEKFKAELGNFALLMALFFCTPLLVGFSIYFVFWHSLHAVQDQINQLCLQGNTRLLKKYIKQILFISIISFLVIGLLYAYSNYTMNHEFNLGILFIFIAIVTVPHSLLMHQLYQVKSFNHFQEKKENYLQNK